MVSDLVVSDEAGFWTDRQDLLRGYSVVAVPQFKGQLPIKEMVAREGTIIVRRFMRFTQADEWRNAHRERARADGMLLVILPERDVPPELHQQFKAWVQHLRRQEARVSLADAGSY